MVKKFSMLALAGMLALPGVALAGSGTVDLESKINELTRQLQQLKKQMAEMKSDQEDTISSIEEKSEGWDLASRIKIYGDFRTRIDYVTADTPKHYTALKVGHGIADFWTSGNVMNRYAAVNSGETVGQFAAAYAGATQNGSGGYTLTGGTTNVTVSSTEYGALQRTFGSTISGILTAGGYMAAPITTLTPSFTNLQNLVSFMNSVGAANRVAIFNEMGYSAANATTYQNDSLWTNRFRLNLRVKAMEDLEFKGRLAMYKAWGMQNNPVDYTANGGMGGGAFMLNSLSFDGNTSRQPTDSVLRVDRAFMNWNNIGGQPIWFSIGRRPTTDGPPAQLRLGADQKMATPTAVMDYPFDGLSLGYAYTSLFGLEKAFGMEDWPGRIRFCYGRGFESGPTDHENGLNDVDFAGLSWDIYKKGNTFATLQSFGAFNIFNVPDNVKFPNPVEYYLYQNGQITFDPTKSDQNLILDRANLGNIYHTSGVFMDKYKDLNYFFLFGWSKTDARSVDEMGTSLLGSFYQDPHNKDGYCFYTGIRYDLPDQGLKLGLEYNYGTKNWIAFTPGNDDLYAAKLATRGSVYEAYGIWNIPAGEAVSKYAKAFLRLGYQHYDYDYTGSGFWLGEPVDIDELKNDPMNAQFYDPIESMDQVYLSMEMWF